MLEDLEDDAGLVDRLLQKERITFTRLRVDTENEFTTALEEFKPDVILSDHSLPRFNSIEALKICIEKKLNLPFILVTGAVSEEFAVNCMKRGADDYVLKSNLSRLPQAIRHALRHRSQDNTRREHEETLRKQNEELSKVNKELDSFVYSVSHNLRSPLSSVLGLVNIARMDALKTEDMVAHYLDMIGKNVSKMDASLQQTLNYVRNAANEVFSEIDLERLVRQGFAEMKYLKGYGKIGLQIEIEKTVPFYSHSFRISVILLNLISNAIKYSDETKPIRFIRVSAKITPSHAEITIHDNGIGIHADYLPNIFNMFYRATEKGEGEGLGLYIANEMLERLNATVAVKSTLDEGTTITLTIPNVGPKKQEVTA